MIPNDYQEWRYCIEKKCGIPLTKTFVQDRLDSLKNASAADTMKFRKLYGDPYWQTVLDWFEKALRELSR